MASESPSEEAARYEGHHHPSGRMDCGWLAGDLARLGGMKARMEHVGAEQGPVPRAQSGSPSIRRLPLKRARVDLSIPSGLSNVSIVAFIPVFYHGSVLEGICYLLTRIYY